MTEGRLAVALADRYRIERELGSGGMATVYLAEDLKHHRKVAIKVLRENLALMLGPERFLREIDIAANLTHPHILPLLDSGDAAGVLYYVMPFVAGESLRGKLARERQLPIGEALRLTTQIASALDYAHRQGVIHRDIKPENILIQDEQALVADFGVALAINSSASEAGRLTQTGLSLGTPAYMSPEQAAGDRAMDGRSDVYALGCALYEMLVGEPPFLGSNAQAVVARVLTERPRPPSESRDTVPASIDAAVLRALAKTPADRFASAADFASALAVAVPSGNAPPVSSRRRWSYALAPLLLVAIVAGAWAVARGRTGAHATAVTVATDSLSTARKSIAVLPFENLSVDASNAYFADGMQDEILTRLAQISDLDVASRTSTQDYASRPDDLTAIAKHLGVAAILEGSVQRAGNRVLINVQLIDGATNRHLWAESYDRELKDIFGVEKEVSQAIASALQAKLSPAEATAIARVPTTNKHAYDLFLKAHYYLDESNRTDDARQLDQAIALTKQALALDSSYVDAWSLLALGDLKVGGHPRQAEEAARRAVALGPNDANAHLMLGSALANRGSEDSARAELAVAAHLAPGSPRPAYVLGIALLEAGRYTDAIGPFRTAASLSGHRIAFYERGPAQALIPLRRYAEARAALERAHAIDPGDVTTAVWLALVYGLGWADTLAARAVIASEPRSDANAALLAFASYWTAVLSRDYPAARADAQNGPSSLFASDGDAHAPRALFLAQVERLEGDSTAARREFRLAYDSLQAWLHHKQGDADLYASASVALAGLGRADEAVRNAERAVAIARKTMRAPDWPRYIENRAEVSAMLGDASGAVKVLRRLLAEPAGFVISVPLLRIDPVWDAIRTDPGFRALLAPAARGAR